MGISLRLPDDLHQELRDLAAKDERSVTQTIVRLLRQGVAQRTTPPPPPTT